MISVFNEKIYLNACNFFKIDLSLWECGIFLVEVETVLQSGNTGLMFFSGERFGRISVVRCGFLTAAEVHS